MAKLIKTHVKTRSEGLFSYLKNVFRVCFESPFTRMISSLKYKWPPPMNIHCFYTIFFLFAGCVSTNNKSRKRTFDAGF